MKQQSAVSNLTGSNRGIIEGEQEQPVKQQDPNQALKEPTPHVGTESNHNTSNKPELDVQDDRDRLCDHCVVNGCVYHPCVAPRTLQMTRWGDTLFGCFWDHLQHSI